ncbi:MAG TPA: PEP-CTERM sorting domain-containing protein [Acetobacteraceae bacterium]|jgi:hypothetical protein|nr:PEP-CTERM sorting domain-containing protein [Acetobacteraceae bacterium]
MRRPLAASVLAAVFLALASAGPSIAAPITVTDVEVPLNEVITLETPVSGAAYVGQIVLTTSAGVIDAWCIDLSHDVYVGANDLAYHIAPIATDFNGTILTSTQIQEIGGLVNYGNELIASGSATAADSAGVQLAIWSIEEPSFTYSGASAAAQAEANMLIAEAPHFGGNAVAFASLVGTQSLAIAAVPEPATLGLLGGGLVMLGIARWRRARGMSR